ncbi:MAG: ATP-binding protein [Candidatus Cyclobacteriaceae bacterium M2_1C_046]
MYQIKTLDEQLDRYTNIKISLNGNEYFSMGDKGVAFVELYNKDLPIHTIEIDNKQLEAASWNFSKGILEIIIRKKKYHVVELLVKGTDNKVLSNTNITFNGRKTLTAATNYQGFVELPLALDEKPASIDQFNIKGFDIKELKTADGENILIVEKIIIKEDDKNNVIVQEKPLSSSNVFSDFDISKLDSIESLTVFYAVFKNYQIEELDEETRQKVDAKFNELVTKMKDSLSQNALTLISSVSDTSYVQDDIKNLLKQAKEENFILEGQQEQFEEKIEMVSNKLAAGLENLDEASRVSLLEDLNLLEQILTENENKFYRNQTNYRQMVNNLKERFFDIEDLENRLSLSEAQRLEEQRVFRQRLILVLLIAAVFAILVILLVYFSNKLKKQKKELVVANTEVQRVNENLENLVFERTKLLEETNKELDTVLYRASHDLRSPICSITGLCNLASTLSNGENAELYEKMILTTQGMDRLLQKLSVISEINQPGEFTPVKLADVVEDVHSQFSKMIEENNINFVVDCPENFLFYSNPELLRIILSNLIENALFYCMLKDSTHHQVILKIKVNKENVTLSLYDNGVGVDQSVSNKLFDMFFRGNEYSKGNGLGLYIVQKSVQVLKGEIVVESEPGKYSKFIVHLPKIKAGKKAIKAAENELKTTKKMTKEIQKVHI